MDYSKKFRELVIDPNLIPFSNWKIDSILEFYHAGNDVLHCLGTDNKHYILKLSRHSDSNFSNHALISKILIDFGWENIQPCIEYGCFNSIEYLVLPFRTGFRLSQNEEFYRSNEKEFCRIFGESIHEIHQLKINVSSIKPRKFHKINDYSKNINVENINKWLIDNAVNHEYNCFIHGDHHNANVLWNNVNISYILDWELAGIGNRDFDLAWSIHPRPSQSIFYSKVEEDAILNSYAKFGEFSYHNYKYYKVLIISHFLSFANNDLQYIKWAKEELNKLISVKIIND